MDLKTKAKDKKISITMTSLQVEPMSRKERRCMDKERLGSNPLIYLMGYVSVKMRNLEDSSPFKPNSPNQAHHEALASCVLDYRAKSSKLAYSSSKSSTASHIFV